MACHEACQYKHDAYWYKKEYEKLKNKIETRKLEQMLESEQKARCNALNERDRLQRRLDEQAQILDKCKDELAYCKKQSLWKEEELEEKLKDERRETVSRIKGMKKEIGCLQKELQDEKWRNEKQPLHGRGVCMMFPFCFSP